MQLAAAIPARALRRWRWGQKQRRLKISTRRNSPSQPTIPACAARSFSLCDLCYSANLATTGSLHRVDPNLCRAYRLCILASARVQFARVSRKHRLAPDDRLVLGAVRLVQEECQRPAPWQEAV